MSRANSGLSQPIHSLFNRYFLLGDIYLNIIPTPFRVGFVKVSPESPSTPCKEQWKILLTYKDKKERISMRMQSHKLKWDASTVIKCEAFEPGPGNQKDALEYSTMARLSFELTSTEIYTTTRTLDYVQSPTWGIVQAPLTYILTPRGLSQQPECATVDSAFVTPALDSSTIVTFLVGAVDRPNSCPHFDAQSSWSGSSGVGEKRRREEYEAGDPSPFPPRRGAPDSPWDFPRPPAPPPPPPPPPGRPSCYAYDHGRDCHCDWERDWERNCEDTYCRHHKSN